MTVFKIEHSRFEYFADFAVYAAAIVLTAGYLSLYSPAGAWREIAVAACLGLFGFSLLEYLVHRFVFHGLEPFRAWHAEHHRRPQAFIGTPTVVTIAILLACIFLPAALLGDRWLGMGLSLGVASGFFAYSWVHHCMHHGRARTLWMKRRKRTHALHHGAHRESDAIGYFGVTTSLWDAVFRSNR